MNNKCIGSNGWRQQQILCLEESMLTPGYYMKHELCKTLIKVLNKIHFCLLNLGFSYCVILEI